MKELDEIYRLYADSLYRYALRLCGNESLAAELVSETFYKAVMSIDSFKEQCSVKTWLCSIAANCYKDFLRKNSRLESLPDDPDIAYGGIGIEQLVESKDSAAMLHKLLHSLEEPYKEVFTLHVFAELKFSDIGAVFGKSEVWARVTFFRAKEKLLSKTKAYDGKRG